MKHLQKYLFRLFVGFLVYGFIHLNFKDKVFAFDLIDRIMMVYTIIITVVIWEILDFAIIKFNIENLVLSRPGNLIKAFFYLTLVSVPLVFAGSGFSEYSVKPFIECDFSDEEFYKNAVSGQVLGWLIIASMLFKIKIKQEQKLEKDLALVQKELLQTKYQNLKNQVNPHFLFNSFSVLQNLIETDAKKAALFLEKLSLMYRFLLEHRNEAMSSMERELEILEVYLYLLKTRHEDRLIVNVNIEKQYHQSFLPTLSLQMLIENAVKHNQFTSEAPLIIDLYVEDDYLIVRNQIRMKGTQPHSTKIGLENIRNQYSLQTDKRVIVSNDEQFFTVKLPVLQAIRMI